MEKLYAYFCKQSMQQSKRQIQVAKLIKEEMNAIFQKEGLNIVNNGMISISNVIVTPDLLEARVYLSFFQIADADDMLLRIQERTSEFRGKLGNGLRHALRNVPVLQFFGDDTLDHVFKMEELFKQIEEDRLKNQKPE
jgi:ribosome-binding factor A